MRRKQHDLPLESRLRTAIDNSNELIRRSNGLRQMARSMANASVSGPNGTGHSQINTFKSDRRAILKWAVDAALHITNADKANIQLFDSRCGALHIAAHIGFLQPFLDFFDCVRGGESACGEALRTGRRVLVEDVTQSPTLFNAASIEALLDAGVRSVQSTPLVSYNGTVLGVISTHWALPGCPSLQSLRQLDLLARTVANFLESLGWDSLLCHTTPNDAVRPNSTSEN